MLDKSGNWWKGDDFTDLRDFVQAYSAENFATARVEQSRCGDCGGSSLRLRVDDEEGGAEKSCPRCGTSALLLDSEDYWEDADPGDASCPCGHEVFEVGVGFALRDDGDIRWVYVGARCVACGTLGVYADWEIDYSPTANLFNKI